MILISVKKDYRLYIKISSFKEYKDFMAISDAIKYTWNSGHTTLFNIPYSLFVNYLEKEKEIFICMDYYGCSWASSLYPESTKAFDVKTFGKMILHMAKKGGFYAKTRNMIDSNKRKLKDITIDCVHNLNYGIHLI